MERRLLVCSVLCWIFFSCIHECSSYCQDILGEKPVKPICQDKFLQGVVGQTLYIDADGAPRYAAVTCMCELKFDYTTTISIAYRSNGWTDADCGIEFEVDNNTFGCKSQESIGFVSQLKNELHYVKVTAEVENRPGCIGIKPETGSLNITCHPSLEYVPPNTTVSTTTTTTSTTPTTTTTTTPATTTRPTTTTTSTTTTTTTPQPTTTTTTTPTTTAAPTTTSTTTTTTTHQPTTTTTTTTAAPTTITTKPTTTTTTVPTTPTTERTTTTTAAAPTTTTTQPAAPTTPTPTTTLGPTSTTEPAVGAQQDDGSNTAALAGGIGGAVAGVLVVIAIIVIIVCFIGRRRKEKDRIVNGHRSLRYVSSGDDVTITENELYDSGTPSHAMNALFVGGIPDTPGAPPETIPHIFAPGTGDRYAVIVDSTRSRPKKERPKLRTFTGPSVDDDVKGVDDDVNPDKSASDYDYNDVEFAAHNPGYEPDYLVPHSPKTVSESGSPYDYIDPGQLEYANTTAGAAANTDNGGYARFINQDSSTGGSPYANADSGVAYVTKDGGDYANLAEH